MRLRDGVGGFLLFRHGSFVTFFGGSASTHSSGMILSVVLFSYIPPDNNSKSNLVFAIQTFFTTNTQVL